MRHAGVACRAYAHWGADYKVQAMLEREGVEFHLGYGDWIRLLRSNGFEIEDLIEFARSMAAEVAQARAFWQQVAHLLDQGEAAEPGDLIDERRQSGAEEKERDLERPRIHDREQATIAKRRDFCRLKKAISTALKDPDATIRYHASGRPLSNAPARVAATVNVPQAPSAPSVTR